MNDETILQKAVTPQNASAYLTSGFDRVGGYVLRASDVAGASAADLYQAHALGFPGSPFAPGGPVHVLLLRATAQLRVEDAVGGNDKEGAARTGGPFIDHPPFTGNGFAPWPGHVAPTYWLRHSRVPAGSELHRVDPGGRRVHIATYVDVATGWQAPAGAAPLASHRVPPAPSRLVGPLATYRGETFAADPLGDGRVVLAAPSAAEGFEPTVLGRHRRVVAAGELDELFELLVRGTVSGLPVRAVDVVQDGGRRGLWVSYTGHVAMLAEGLGFTKIDAGLYETFVAPDALADEETLQEIPSSWSAAVHGTSA